MKLRCKQGKPMPDVPHEGRGRGCDLRDNHLVQGAPRNCCIANRKSRKSGHGRHDAGRQALPSRLRYLAGSAVEHCVVTASANVAGPLLVIALRLGDGRRRIS